MKKAVPSTSMLEGVQGLKSLYLVGFRAQGLGVWGLGFSTC